VTAAFAGLAMIQSCRFASGSSLAPFLFLGIGAVVVALALQESDVVIFMQAGMLILFACSAGPFASRRVRKVLVALMGCGATMLSLMLLGAWGMSH